MSLVDIPGQPVTLSLRTVIIVPFAGLDLFGQLHAVTRADYIRGTIKNLEMYMDIGYQQSRVHGPAARQFVIVFDLKDFNIKQYTWRPASEVIIGLIKTYEANYPEILKACYLINGEYTQQGILYIYSALSLALCLHCSSQGIPIRVQRD